MTTWGALIRKDVRIVYRDGFLLFMLGYPAVLAVALRLGAPLVPVNDLDLYLAPGVVLFGGMLIGIVLGYGLIEERENRTWLLLRVLPLRERTLFAYLVITAAGLSLPVALAAALLYGLPAADLAGLVLMTAVAALASPVIMLLLGALASNKIEGLALAKVISMSSAIPALAFLLSPGGQLALVWNPFYWVYLGLLRAYAGEGRLGQLAIQWPAYPSWMFAVVPALLCITASALLARIYRARAGVLDS